MKDFILKLQNLPEHIRKLIIISVAGILAVILGIWWLVHSYNTINNFNKDQFREQVKWNEFQAQVNENNAGEK